MPGGFDGQTAWVTGAGRGIGRAVADHFLAGGAQVIGLDLACDWTADGFAFRSCDMADADAIAATGGALLAQGRAPDILVHAAGVLRLGGIAALTSDDWQSCMAVNAGGAFHLLRLLAPIFRERKAGAIVAVASNAAHVPRIGMAAYGASKAALASLVRSVGLELAPHGVRCNLVSPGSTDTLMLRGMWDDPATGSARIVTGDPAHYRLGIPLGKIGQVRDVAEAVAFLASSSAGHITLQDLVVDGGATLGS